MDTEGRLLPRASHQGKRLKRPFVVSVDGVRSEGVSLPETCMRCWMNLTLLLDENPVPCIKAYIAMQIIKALIGMVEPTL